MAFQIKPMEQADIAGAIKLWKQTEGIGLDDDSDTPEKIAAYLKRNPESSFVAYKGTELVGAVLSGHDGRRGYLHHLAVKKEYRKQGLGGELVNSCLKALKKIGIPKCNIFLFETNQAGRAFWLKSKWNARPDLAILQKLT
jgi:ribosomal protein S18 acetylase RimI-like enzyme